MKVRLLRDARITHKAGEIVEVSPTEFQFLVSVGSAVELAVKAPVEEAETPETIEKPAKAETKEKKTRKK